MANQELKITKVVSRVVLRQQKVIITTPQFLRQEDAEKLREKIESDLMNDNLHVVFISGCNVTVTTVDMDRLVEIIA